MDRSVPISEDYTEIVNSFSPETNGTTERANQELEMYLRIFTSFQQEDWAFQFPIVMMALNSRVS